MATKADDERTVYAGFTVLLCCCVSIACCLRRVLLTLIAPNHTGCFVCVWAEHLPTALILTTNPTNTWRVMSTPESTHFNVPALPLLPLQPFLPAQAPQSPQSVPAEPIRRKRLRFSVTSDLVLLKEAIAQNPFGNSTKWSKVQEVVRSVSGKKFSLRCLRERVDRLIQQWLRGDTESIRRSGTDEQQKEKKLLLRVVTDIRQKYKTSRKNLNQNRVDVRGQVAVLPFDSPWNTHSQVQPSTSYMAPANSALQIKQELSPEQSSSLEQSQSPESLLFTGTERTFHAENIDTRDLSSPEPSLSVEPSLSPSLDTEVTFETSTINADPLETSQHNDLATDHTILDDIQKTQKYRHAEERKLLLEENKLKIEEKKLALEERKLAMEEKKLVLEEKREEHRKVLEEKRLQLEKEKLKMEIEHRQKKMEMKMEELKHRMSAEERQQDIIEILLLK